jgi:hypothetical protein
MNEETKMKPYVFHHQPINKSLEVKDENKKTLFTICRGKSFFLDVVFADGTIKEGLTVEDILNLIPDATITSIKCFASFIYLFARSM